MLSPEVEEGNVEYKRYLINLDENRLEQLSTQMKWRLAEGNNEAIYYLGVDDDGTPFNLSDEQKKETLNNFTLLLKKNNADIVNFEVIKSEININKVSYFKITIRTKSKIYPEIRVVLLGDTLSGKTTFLSNILLNKVDNDTEARLYLMNHKHELESKKTSSINCFYKIWNGVKFTFIEAPGDNEYTRTRYKILLGTHPDICLLFSNCKNNYNEKYLNTIKYLGIPYIPINIFDSISEYNCKKLINKNKLFDEINNNLLTNNKSINSPTIFNILSVYPHTDLGIIVSGFLISGKLEINKSIGWYSGQNITYSNKFKIKSIHISSEPIKEISSKSMLTLCLKPLNNKNKIKNKNKLKYGFLSNKPINMLTKIKFNYWVTTNDLKNELPNNIFGYCENKLVYLVNIKKNSDHYEAFVTNYYEGNGPIIIDNEHYHGIIKII